jgi:hypothetical protein
MSHVKIQSKHEKTLWTMFENMISLFSCKLVSSFRRKSESKSETTSFDTFDCKSIQNNSGTQTRSPDFAGSISFHDAQTVCPLKTHFSFSGVVYNRI